LCYQNEVEGITVKGRKPKLAVLEGGAMPGRCPGPPDWLPEYARSEWKRVAPELHKRKVLGRDAMAMLEQYCAAVGSVWECEEAMARDGRIVSTAAGLVAHPANRVQVAAMREARLLAAELGLTPHRRGKYVEAEPRDEWEGMIG
jgi:P27 family predicted phage terminase small subunit